MMIINLLATRFEPSELGASPRRNQGSAIIRMMLDADRYGSFLA
jgi:hypothetical protein